MATKQDAPYTPKEIDLLLSMVGKGATLSELESELNRSPYGVMRKIQRLSFEYPKILNPEKVRDYVRQHYQQHKDELLERNRLFYLLHKGDILKRQRRYTQEHKKERREYSKRYYQRHRKERLEYFKQHDEQHRDERLERKRRRHQLLSKIKRIAPLEIGYPICNPRLYRGKLSIPITEKGIDMSVVAKDYEDGLEKLMSGLPCIISLTVSPKSDYKGNYIIISADRDSKNYTYAIRFLEAYRKNIKNQILD